MLCFLFPTLLIKSLNLLTFVQYLMSHLFYFWLSLKFPWVSFTKHTDTRVREQQTTMALCFAVFQADKYWYDSNCGCETWLKELSDSKLLCGDQWNNKVQLNIRKVREYQLCIDYEIGFWHLNISFSLKAPNCVNPIKHTYMYISIALYWLLKVELATFTC